MQSQRAAKGLGARARGAAMAVFRHRTYSTVQGGGVMTGFGAPSIGLACALMLVAEAAWAADAVSRLPLQNSDFPISAAVTVTAGTDLVFVSGALPPVIDKSAPKGSPAAYGTMETQTTGALTQIKATLARMGLGMGDVVKMTVFMVGDPAQGGKLDFAGMMAGYEKFFGTKDQPNKPARSAMQVAALVVPGPLLEIEVIAAKPH
jgi:enamine deaminase RidA (YjgF/YER057c/UK114 family)